MDFRDIILYIREAGVLKYIKDQTESKADVFEYIFHNTGSKYNQIRRGSPVTDRPASHYLHHYAQYTSLPSQKFMSWKKAYLTVPENFGINYTI